MWSPTVDPLIIIMAFAVMWLMAEILFFVRRRNDREMEGLVAILLCGGISAAILLWSDEPFTTMSIRVGFATVLLPATILFLANELLVRLKDFVLQHVCLGILAATILAPIPVWALMVTCAWGPECL